MYLLKEIENEIDAVVDYIPAETKVQILAVPEVQTYTIGPAVLIYTVLKARHTTHHIVRVEPVDEVEQQLQHLVRVRCCGEAYRHLPRAIVVSEMEVLVHLRQCSQAHLNETVLPIQMPGSRQSRMKFIQESSRISAVPMVPVARQPLINQAAVDDLLVDQSQVAVH